MHSAPGVDDPPRSRRLPWQLPFLAFVFLCTLTLTLFQPRGEGAEEAVAVAGAAVEDSVSDEGAIVEVPLEESEGDPLEDPSLEPSALESADRVNILVLGTDGRDEEDGPPRTDLIILAMVNRSLGRVTLVSIPRDLWVPIPGYGEGKINTAFFLGALNGDGSALARQTVELLTGREIHHVVRIDFAGFRNVVDAMGGVTVSVPEPIDDPQYPDGNYGTLHLQIPAGEQVMDGETALRYARTRYGGTDEDRSARQQRVIAAIRNRATEPAQLARAPLYLRALYREVETDLALGDLFALARLGRSLGPEALSMHTIGGDLVQSIITWNGQDALIYESSTLRAALDRWERGQ